MKKCMLVMFGTFLLISSFFAGAMAEDKVLTMSTTTSTESSGLLDVLLPEFKKDTGIAVKVLAKGTGAALKDGRMAMSMSFLSMPWKKKKNLSRRVSAPNVMPSCTMISSSSARQRIQRASKGQPQSPPWRRSQRARPPSFPGAMTAAPTPRNSRSGRRPLLKLVETSQKLVIEGKETQVVSKKPADSAAWYYSIGQGMGKTITFADEKNAYTLTDRGTYIAYKYGKTPAVDLEILCEGDDSLANPYGVIPVNPKKFPHVKYDLAQQFADWLISPRGQKVIADFKLEGKQLFFPDAIK